MNLYGILVTAFVVGFSGAMMPGPLLTVTISESVRRGAKAGPLLMVGHAILEAALITALLLGLWRYLKLPSVEVGISLGGGVMMAVMGSAMLLASRNLVMVAEGAPETPGMHPVLAGILVSLSNPYWTIWWATTGLLYLKMGLQHGLTGIAVFFIGHIGSDFAWYSLVSVGVSRGRAVMSNSVYRWLIRLCGVVLVLFAAGFLRHGAILLAATP